MENLSFKDDFLNDLFKFAIPYNFRIDSLLDFYFVRALNPSFRPGTLLRGTTKRCINKFPYLLVSCVNF